MKKLCLLILILALTVCAIASCSGYYTPVEPTEEEARVVMTLSYGDISYDVTYDLYRGLFLNVKNEISGGDDSVWVGTAKEEYEARAHERVSELIFDIYSAFAVCHSVGIDPFSSDFNNKISEYVKAAVDDEPYNGNYSAYLDALKDANMNYKAQELILRWGIAQDAIDEYYIGTASADDISGQITIGNLVFTPEDVESFYFSEECVRVIRGCMVYNGINSTEERAEDMRDAVLNVSHLGADAVAAAMAGAGSITAQNELINGYVIGRYNLNHFYYDKITEAAFALADGEVSAVIPINDDLGSVCYVIYRAEKSEEHFDSCYDEIASIFLRDRVGEILSNAAAELQGGAEATELLSLLDYSEISMD